MLFKYFQKLAVLFFTAALLLILSGCADAPDIVIPPIPTYSDEISTASAPPQSTVEPSVPATAVPTAEPVQEPALTVALQPTPEPIAVPSPTPHPDVPVISLSGETLPGNMVQGNVATLHGLVSCDKGNLIRLTAMLLDTGGNTVQACYFEPGQSNFSLAGTVNAQLRFAVLEPGTYVYYLSAQAEYNGKSSEEELIYHSFTVYSSRAQMNSDVSEGELAYTAKITQDTSNAGLIWNFLVVYLDNPFGAAGVLANIDIESGCNSKRVQGDFSEGFAFSESYTELVDTGNLNRDSFIGALPAEGYGSGYGLCQWSFDRKEGLYDLAQERGTSVGDLETQCIYIIMELEMDYPGLLELLKTTDDARAAAREFCFVFEQAGELGDRAGIAEDYLERFAS